MSKSKAPRSATAKTSDGGSTIAFSHKSFQQESSSSSRNLKSNHQPHRSHGQDSSLKIIERTKSSTNQQNSNQQKNRIKKLKCVFVGDDSIGKTSLIVSYTTNGYPADYVPTTFDTYSVLVTIDNKPCQLQLCDTAGQDDFDSIRPLCYNHADVFLVSFSVVSPRSFRNIRQKWLPEIRRTITNGSDGGKGAKLSSSRSMPPFILIGTQCDLRHDVKVLIELDSIGEQPISTDYAKSIAKKLGAIDYIECSALTQKNLKEVFDTAIIAGLEYQKNQSRLHKGEHHRYNHAHARHHQHQKHCHHTQHKNHDSKPKHYKSFTKIGPQNMIVANGGRSQTPPIASTCPNDYNYGAYKHNGGDSQGGANHDSMIYQDFYYHGRRHFVPTMPTKMANISDAKLVGWRKSLTKLSAQEALKSEAAEEAANSRNHDDDDDDEEEEEEEEEEDDCEIYHENDEYVENPLVQPKLTTFSPLPSPIMSPKVSRKNIIMKKGGGTLEKSLQSPPPLIVSTKSSHQTKSRHSSSVVAGGLFSDPEDDQGFHDETLPSDGLIDSDEHRKHLHHHPKISVMKSKANHCHHFSHKQKTKTQIISSAKQLSCSCSSYSSSTSPCPQISSNQPSIPTPYDYSGCYGYKQTMIYNHNPYACYQTPYGTTVATADAAVPGAPLGPIMYRSRVAPPTPVVIHNRSIFQPINGTNSTQSQSQQPPTRPPMTKTNLATTLRSSSFFFLPSKTLKMMKQQRKQQEKEQRSKQLNGGKVIKSDSIVSSLSSTESSRSSISSCSSIHSSNELFKNLNHHHGEDGQQQHQHLAPTFTSSHRKSMLDMFHQMMSTSVTELRNRKCSNVFKRLASSLSSSGSGSSHNSTSSSSATSKEKQRLKSEKLKDLYYYDSYDYEEIDLDHRAAGKCCPRIWSLCCFTRNF